MICLVLSVACVSLVDIKLKLKFIPNIHRPAKKLEKGYFPFRFNAHRNEYLGHEIYLTIGSPSAKVIVTASSTIKVTACIVIFIITPLVISPIWRSTTIYSSCCGCSSGFFQAFTNLKRKLSRLLTCI